MSFLFDPFYADKNSEDAWPRYGERVGMRLRRQVPFDRRCPVESPRITLGWTDGNRARRHVQNPLLERFIASLFPDERRHPRFFAPPIVAYLGSVGASRLFPIINVSVGGFCLRSEELWTPGLVMPIALQRWRTIPQDDPESLTVQAMLVRREGNEAGFAIALPPQGSLLLPRMRTQQQNILLQQMSDFLKDLPDPMASPPAPNHPYAPTSARLPLKVPQIETMPDRIHKLSA